MTTVDVRTGFLREKILFNGKEDFPQDLHTKQVCMFWERTLQMCSLKTVKRQNPQTKH